MIANRATFQFAFNFNWYKVKLIKINTCITLSLFEGGEGL